MRDRYVLKVKQGCGGFRPAARRAPFLSTRAGGPGPSLASAMGAGTFNEEHTEIDGPPYTLRAVTKRRSRGRLHQDCK